MAIWFVRIVIVWYMSFIMIDAVEHCSLKDTFLKMIQDFMGMYICGIILDS